MKKKLIWPVILGVLSFITSVILALLLFRGKILVIYFIFLALMVIDVLFMVKGMELAETDIKTKLLCVMHLGLCLLLLSVLLTIATFAESVKLSWLLIPAIYISVIPDILSRINLD